MNVFERTVLLFHSSRIKCQNKKAKLIHLQCVSVQCTVWRNCCGSLRKCDNHKNVTSWETTLVAFEASYFLMPSSALHLSHRTVTGLKLKCYKYLCLFFAFDGKLQSGKWYKWHWWWAKLNEIREFWKLEFIFAVFFPLLWWCCYEARVHWILFSALLSQTTQ